MINVGKVFIGILAIVFSAQCFFSAAADKKSAPAVTARDINGKQMELKAHIANGPVIVWFWNSCCGIKKQQYQSLKNLYATHKKDGLEIIAISEDGVKKTAKTKEAVAVNKMPFIVVMDVSMNILNQFQGYAVPAVYLINKNGEIEYSHSGYVPGDEKKLEQQVGSLFAALKQ